MLNANDQRCVMVCQHSSCLTQGAAKVLLAFQIADLPDDTFIMPSGCLGQCSTGPTVVVVPEQTWYCRMQVSDVPEVVEQHLKNGKPVEKKLHPRFHQSYY